MSGCKMKRDLVKRAFALGYRRGIETLAKLAQAQPPQPPQQPSPMLQVKPEEYDKIHEAERTQRKNQRLEIDKQLAQGNLTPEQRSQLDARRKQLDDRVNELSSDWKLQQQQTQQQSAPQTPTQPQTPAQPQAQAGGSFDFTKMIPGYDKLTEEQQGHVKALGPVLEQLLSSAFQGGLGGGFQQQSGGYPMMPMMPMYYPWPQQQPPPSVRIPAGMFGGGAGYGKA